MNQVSVTTRLHSKAQPPGSTGKDWPDGRRSGWVDTKQEGELVNKHLRADTLPAGMETDSDKDRDREDQHETRPAWVREEVWIFEQKSKNFPQY